MKGIILAGGKATRLYPITKGVCKQLLPVYDKPMVYYPLSVLMLAGIKDILIISASHDIPRFKDLLGDGKELGIKFSYAIQKEPRGIAESFIIGEDFIGRDNVCLTLGDNIFYGHNLGELLKESSFLKEGAIVFGYYVKDPQRYGVIEFDKNCNAVSIEAASKAAADFLVKSYIRTYGFPAIIIRPCNNYGPWQYPEKLIPLAILKILKNEKVPIYADGKNVREWLYVDDCAEGILQILKEGKIGEIYNLGSQEEKQNVEVVSLILKILKKDKNMIKFVKDRPGHDIRYRLNIRKVFNEIGWKPRIKFEEGIKITVSWFLKCKGWLFNK